MIPECDEIEFNPVALTKKWKGTWTCFIFDFKAAEDVLGETLLVRLSIQVGNLEIAHIKFAIEVIAQQTQPELLEARTANPLTVAKLDKQTVEVYRKIFVSYSIKDKEVVEAYRFAQMAIGNDIFADTYSIRRGQEWQTALNQAILNADIFQLFWSEHSARSPTVRDEGEYALKYRCPDDCGNSFIRPVFWTIPLQPEPPEALKHLHFRYAPFIIPKDEEPEQKQIALKNPAYFLFNLVSTNISLMGLMLGIGILFALQVLTITTIRSIGFSGAALLGFMIRLIMIAIFFMITVRIMMRNIRIALNFCDGRRVWKIRDHSKFAFPTIVNFGLGLILYWLIVFVGTVLLIVPGIIGAIKFRFFGYFIVDENRTAIGALKASSAITKDAKEDLFVFSIIIGIINILGAVAGGIGLFITLPWTMMAKASAYRQLSGTATQYPSFSKTTGYRWFSRDAE